jgi:hypothetical protein
LAASLENTGSLISFERINGSVVLAEWGRALHAAAVGIDWKGIHVLSFVEYHGLPAVKVPVLVGSKNRSGKIEPNELRALWMQKMGQPVAVEILPAAHNGQQKCQSPPRREQQGPNRYAMGKQKGKGRAVRPRGGHQRRK